MLFITLITVIKVNFLLQASHRLSGIINPQMRGAVPLLNCQADTCNNIKFIQTSKITCISDDMVAAKVTHFELMPYRIF